MKNLLLKRRKIEKHITFFSCVLFITEYAFKMDQEIHTIKIK